MTEIDPEAMSLLEAREAARRERDFQRADQLRDRLLELGWATVDSPSGSRLESLLDRVESPDGRPSLLTEPDLYDFSLVVVLYGWPQDVRRLFSALDSAERRIEGVVVDVSEAGYRPADLVAPASQIHVRVLRPSKPAGHGAALNTGLHQARGRIVAFVEPSLEFGPSLLIRLEEALGRPEVGLAGPFGLKAHDEHHFDPADGPDAQALEYLLAFRRRDASRIGDVDPHFRYYRNFDLDFSYQARRAGLAIRAVESAGVTRHLHRVWESTPLHERDRLSRRNFNLWMDHWVRSR